MKKDKKTLLKIILIPVLIVVLIQEMMPFLTVVFSGVKQSLENNNVRMDNHMVENSKVVLENDMIENWRSVYKEADMLSEELSELLQAERADINEFLSDDNMQQSYLRNVFSKLVEVLQYNETSGIFLILANSESADEEAAYHGFFVRDSDPQTKTALNTDLLLERGSKALSHSISIPLDSSWSTDFHFMGNGVRSCDDFFYRPYLAGLEYSDSRMSDLGYWSRPFILENHYMDNHKMITYSLPLAYDGVIYGVLGAEVSESYLLKYFSVQELDTSLNAGYALMIHNEDVNYELVTGKGNLYDTVLRSGKEAELVKKDDNGLYRVNGVTSGKQNIYAVLKPMSLYGNNVPYDDTEWVMCGIVTEESIYGFGRSLYARMLIAIFGSLIPVIIILIILIKRITKPVYQLMDSVRGGVEKLHEFSPSGILEVDELHSVIEGLTDSQAVAEKKLMEEKERYRIAVESSHDMFFYFRRRSKMLEIVNSENSDGVWDCNEHPEYLDNNCIYPDDREHVVGAFVGNNSETYVEFRLRKNENEEYIWVKLTARIIKDTKEGDDYVVGCVHNIQQRKELEEAQRNKQIYDAVTNFYRAEYGMQCIRKSYENGNDGVLVLIDIDGFSRLNEQFGLFFGDILLERLALMTWSHFCSAGIKKGIYVRVDSDVLLVRAENIDAEQMSGVVDELRKEFAGLCNEEYLVLNFRCGIVQTAGGDSFEDSIRHLKMALQEAKDGQADTVIYRQNIDEKQVRIEDCGFAGVDSFEQFKQLSLSSITINLLDRTGEIKPILDILAIKLHDYFTINNLVITRFNSECLVNSMTYCRRKNERQKGWNGIVRCGDSECHSYIESKQMQQLFSIGDDELTDPTINQFIGNENGYVFHMRDNNTYSGSIFYLGCERRLSADEEKSLEEISSIIQNRVNLLRHDLSDKAKSDFLARMSHEIRTPMNGIMGMTEIALEEGQTDERRLDCLRKIKSSSGYLLGLLNDILDMSKIESGKMHLVFDKYSLKKTLYDIKNLMDVRMIEKDIHFTQEIELIHDWFIFDELRIKQILMNMLGNAVKYTNHGGNIRLTVKETEGKNEISGVYFAVEDDGIGIEKDKQQLIFQRFEQADDSERARRQGTGLGLSICSSLVHMMGSEIELESEPNKGSIFSFTINIKWIDDGKTADEPAKFKLNLDGKRVLVVEDNTLNMEIIHVLLEKYGVEVDEAENGLEAVKKFSESSLWHYDLILMDIMMPVMDGLEAAKEIRKLQREDSAAVPIIAMSANAFDEDVKQSIASGMNAHLSKPINVAKLEETLSSFIRS